MHLVETLRGSLEWARCTGVCAALVCAGCYSPAKKLLLPVPLKPTTLLCMGLSGPHTVFSRYDLKPWILTYLMYIWMRCSPSQSQHWNGRKTTRHRKRSAPRQMSRRRAQHARCTRHTLAQRRLQSLAALRPAWRLSANWSPRKFAKLRNGHTRMKTPCAHLRQWCADARTFLVARLRARFGTGSGLLVYLLPHSCPSSPAFETGKPHEKLLGIPDVEPLH